MKLGIQDPLMATVVYPVNSGVGVFVCLLFFFTILLNNYILSRLNLQVSIIFNYLLLLWWSRMSCSLPPFLDLYQLLFFWHLVQTPHFVHEPSLVPSARSHIPSFNYKIFLCFIFALIPDHVYLQIPFISTKLLSFLMTDSVCGLLFTQ